MGKRWIVIALVVVVVTAVLFIMHGSFNALCEVGQVQWQAGSFAARPHVNPLRCKAIAIVTPPVRQGMAGLQESVAKELQHSLRSTAPALKVAVYRHMAAAKRAKPDYFIRVTPREWRCSAWPLLRLWAARVLIEGSPDGMPAKPLPASTGFPPATNVVVRDLPGGVDPAMLKQSLAQGRRDYRDLHVDVALQGTTRGIFSMSHLTSSVAESVADKVVEEIRRDGVDPPDPYKASR